jgi:uncharacterized membrane protein YGL010W
MSKQPTITLLETLFGQSKEYLENRVDLIKMKVADKTASIASTVITGIVLFVVFFIFFIVLNIGLGLLIGDLVGRASWGFLILAALYAIAGLVLFSARNKIFKSPVTAMIFRKFL